MIFFGVFFILDYDSMCSKKDFTQEKSIFMQPLQSPITPLTVAALRMIICKRPVPPDDHLQEASPSVSSFARGRPLRMTICTRPVPSDHHLQEAGPLFWQPQKGHDKCIFETLHDEPKCCWVSTNQISMKIRIKIFTFAYGQGWRSSMWLRRWSPVLSRDGWNNYETTFGLLR